MTSRTTILANRSNRLPVNVYRLRVLGVDPALAGATGYGVIQFEGSSAKLLRFGALKFPARATFASRLREIHQLIARLVEEFAPDAVAVESVFTALNVRTALKLAEIFQDAGLPPGVVNIINGVGEVTGAALVAHPGVDKIAFTGSAAVGKSIVRGAADTLKRVTLELGGKSPNVFFADADWEAAVDGALFGVFINQGEVCSAGSRILVEKKIYSKFVEAMTEKTRRIKLGPPLERETKMGPLVSKEQYDRVTSYLELGKKEAKTAIGGGRPKAFGKGYYIEPTIFYDVDNSARISREEIFGPVASVIPFENEGDAIKIANDTPYGLAAYVWSKDNLHARRVGARIRAGQVTLNGAAGDMNTPFGGFKMSGNGREWGEFGLRDFLELKAVIGVDAA